MEKQLAELRKEYTLKTLDEKNVLENPFEQFNRWFEEAVISSVNEPNAMFLSTVDRFQHPNGRIVLLKDFDKHGFAFYTNCKSQKGDELLENPHASLTFFWPELERQIRIRGSVTVISSQESDAYFAIRPRPSQIGAWVSNQSKVVTGREELEDRQKELEVRFDGGPVPRPPHWGGFRLSPLTIEFWQGRRSRLHDRILYKRDRETAEWEIVRLAP